VVEVTGTEVTVAVVDVEVTEVDEVEVLVPVKVVGEADNVVEVDGGTAVDENIDVTAPQPGSNIANRSIRSAKILKVLFIYYSLINACIMTQ
jgi:hypothetical protein